MEFGLSSSGKETHFGLGYTVAKIPIKPEHFEHLINAGSFLVFMYEYLYILVIFFNVLVTFTS